jgi:outer membrane lipoprotein carrier protein
MRLSMTIRSLVSLLAPLALCAGLGLTAAAQPAASTEADALAARLQSRYDAIRSFSAAFSHTYEGGVLRRKTTETGTVEIKKPGRMRWEYEKPERKLFVSDGRKLYAYVPADRQVTISNLPAEDQAATPALFLMGRGNLRRDFSVSLAGAVPGAPADAIAIVLVPKTTVPDYERLTMVVDRESLTLRMLVTRDAQGGTSTFTFTNLRENVTLADSRFSFTIPRGADVVTQN